MTTSNRITIDAIGWHLVLDKKGYIFCNSHNIQFAYSDSEPSSDFIGESATSYKIGNDDDSNLWIKNTKGSMSYNAVEY